MNMDSLKADNAALRKELFRKEQNYKTDLAAKDEEIFDKIMFNWQAKMRVRQLFVISVPRVQTKHSIL